MQNYYKGYFIKKYHLFLVVVPFLFISCALKEPNISQSATMLIKTPTIKFYDRGFIKKFDNRTELTIFSIGVPVLNLTIYKNQICQDSFKCLSLKEFNAKNLSSTYKDDFLEELINKDEKNIIFEDKKNKITIKILKD